MLNPLYISDVVLQVKWSTFADFAKGIGYRWVVLLLWLFVVQQSAERLGEVTLSQWTDDPKLSNLTALHSDSADRMDLNKYYITVLIAYGVTHGKCLDEDYSFCCISRHNQGQK